MTAAVQRAAYELMHGSRAGLESIAAWLGKSPHTLRAEVNPNIVGAKLGLVDAVNASVFTGNLAVLNAFAAECGCTVIPAPHEQGGDVITELAAVSANFAALVNLINEATRTEPNARMTRALEAAGAKLIAATQRAVAHAARGPGAAFETTAHGDLDPPTTRRAR